MVKYAHKLFVPLIRFHKYLIINKHSYSICCISKFMIVYFLKLDLALRSSTFEGYLLLLRGSYHSEIKKCAISNRLIKQSIVILILKISSLP